MGVQWNTSISSTMQEWKIKSNGKEEHAREKKDIIVFPFFFFAIAEHKFDLFASYQLSVVAIQLFYTKSRYLFFFFLIFMLFCDGVTLSLVFPSFSFEHTHKINYIHSLIWYSQGK